MSIVSVVLEKPLGSQKEGAVLQLESEVAEALCGSGICREATSEDMDQDNEEEVVEEGEDEEDDTPEMVQDSVSRISRSIESKLTQATEKAAEKLYKSATPTRPNFAQARDKSSEGKGTFKSLGEFVQVATKKAQGDSSAIRAMSACKKSVMADIISKGDMSISGGSGHQGGDLVPTEFAKTLWKLSFESVPDLHGMCSQYPMQNQTLKLPLWVQSSATAGITSTVVGEGSIINDTVGVTATAQLDLVKFATLVNVTDELERFNSYALDAVLRQIVPQRIRYAMNDSFVNGTNSQVNLVGNAATTIVTRATTGRINFNDILAMDSRLFDDFVDDAIWLVNPSSIPELYSLSFPSRTATNPFPAFTPGVFGQENLLGPRPVGSLLGHAVHRLENVPSLGYLGDIILYSPKSIAAASTGLIADSTPYLFFNYAQNSYRFMWYADTVSLMNTPYVRKDGSTASNIVILSSASSSS